MAPRLGHAGSEVARLDESFQGILRKSRQAPFMTTRGFRNRNQYDSGSVCCERVVVQDTP